ncbi:MAG TPA: BON domain-containing protein [Polyangiaceae bacterium]
MRLPLEGLVCVFIAAGCSTEKPAKNADDYESVATSDATVTTEPRESYDSEPASYPETSASTDPDAAARRRAAASTAPATIGDSTPATSKTRSEASATTRNDTQPDNTKVNERDTEAAALTPMDQGENSADLKITQQIRQAVMADGSLSFTAKNVKIITNNRKVTLRGPVKSAAERASIEAAARKFAGPGMVDNQLEVAP